MPGSEPGSGSVATNSNVWYLGDGMSGSDRASVNRKR